MWNRCPPNVLNLFRKSFCEMFENWEERKTWEHLEAEVCAGMSLRNVPLVRGCEEMKHLFSIVMFLMCVFQSSSSDKSGTIASFMLIFVVAVGITVTSCISSSSFVAGGPSSSSSASDLRVD